MPLRLLLGALLAVAWAPTALGQRVPCENGVASHAGTTYTCDGIDLMARVSLEAMGATGGNSLWGWTDPESGREYALMGVNTGLFFVDVTVPSVPALLGRLPTATAVSLWRDVRVYGNHAYVVSEARDHGLQVFDLTRLRGLSPNPARLFDADDTFRGEGGASLGSVHTFFVNEATGYGYAVGARPVGASGWACGGGLYAISLADPARPAFAGCLASEGYTHEVTCVRYQGPDTRYRGREVCFAANPGFPATGTGGGYDRLTIADVEDKQAPSVLGEAIYPNPGYMHQGWLTEDHRYFLANDELDEVNYGFGTRTLVFDVADLEAPEYVGSFSHGTRSIDHNLYIRDGYVFASNYTTGLRVLDLAAFSTSGEPGDIATVAYFDTHPEHDDPVFQGAWNNYPFFASGNVIVSDINRGLFVLRPTTLRTSVEDDAPPVPVSLEAFPNPFSERATVQLTLDVPASVRVEVLDVLGRRVAVLHDGPLAAGPAEPMEFVTGDLPVGVYVVRVTGPSFVVSRPITRVR
jgi:choice-of-anchor B domain-containing protein